MVPFGTTFPIPFTVAVDANGNPVPYGQPGAPVTPATAVLTIVQPDQSVLTYTLAAHQVTVVAAGSLLYPFTPTQAGRHAYAWQSTTPAVGLTDVFDVARPLSPSIIGLADAKTHLGMAATWTTDDAELLRKLAALTSAMEEYKHEVIVPRQVTEEKGFDAVWGSRAWPLTRKIRLDQVPVIGLVSVVSQDGTITWPAANFDVDANTGLVTTIAGPPVRGLTEWTYNAGYPVIPGHYIETGLILLQHHWETRRGPGGLNGVIGPEELADFRHFTSWPRKAVEEFGPVRPVVM